MRTLKKILRALLLPLVAAILLFEEWGWEPLAAAFARLARLPLWAALERKRSARLPPAWGAAGVWRADAGLAASEVAGALPVWQRTGHFGIGVVAGRQTGRHRAAGSAVSVDAAGTDAVALVRPLVSALEGLERRRVGPGATTRPSGAKGTGLKRAVKGLVALEARSRCGARPGLPASG